MTKDADLAAIIYRLLISSSASRWAPRGVLSSSVGAWQTWSMKRDVLSHRGYRFPPEIISHAVWLYHRAPQQAVGKMTEGPSKSAVRSRLQTTPSGCH